MMANPKVGTEVKKAGLMVSDASQGACRQKETGKRSCSHLWPFKRASCSNSLTPNGTLPGCNATRLRRLDQVCVMP